MPDTPETCAVVDLGAHDNPDHIMCPTCGVIKEVKHFRRKATLAQAKAWGYSGRVTLEYVGKSCKSCNKPPKPLSKLTPLQIKQRISSGNHTGSMGQAQRILENRIARGKEGILNGVLTRMQKQASISWANVLEDVDTAIKRSTRQAAQQKSRSSHPLRIEYANLIADTARVYKKEIQRRIKAGEAKPDNILVWQQLMSEKDKRKITEHFNAIPPLVRARMRHDAILQVNGESSYIIYAPDKTKL
jgi:hypothetical protein